MDQRPGYATSYRLQDVDGSDLRITHAYQLSSKRLMFVVRQRRRPFDNRLRHQSIQVVVDVVGRCAKCVDRLREVTRVVVRKLRAAG